MRIDNANDANIVTVLFYSYHLPACPAYRQAGGRQALYFQNIRIIMTLWHRRLIIFLTKVFGVIFLIIAISLFFYYQYFYRKDNLIKYVPADAAFYSTFRLNNELKGNPFTNKMFLALEKNYNLPNIDFSKLNYMVGYNSALALMPNFTQNNLNFDYLLLFDFNGKPENISILTNQLKNKNVYFDILQNQTLKRNILAISNSNNLITEVKKISVQESPSLGQDLNVLLNLSKFKLNYIGKIYLNLEPLSKNLNMIKDIPTKIALASLADKNSNKLFLGIKMKDNKLIIESSNISLTNKSQFLMAKIPADTILNLSFYNAADKFEKISKILSRQEPSYFKQLNQNLNYIQDQYNLDYKKDILSLFSGQAQLLATADNHYILALKQNSVIDQESINKLEQIVKNYIASQNPEESQKILPDKSVITQIVKKPEKYIFKTETINKTSLFYLENNTEIAYFIKDNIIYLANSRDKLRDLLNQNNLIELSNLSKCYDENSSDFSENLTIDKNLILKYVYIPEFFTHLTLSPGENGKFWLCLE